MTHWTGPEEGDREPDGVTLKRPVPGERWPYGPPEAHEDCCGLHAGGLFCDCQASAADEDDW